MDVSKKRGKKIIKFDLSLFFFLHVPPSGMFWERGNSPLSIISPSDVLKSL